MSNYEIGDLVVLKSGSMRMCVESQDDSGVRVVWCHEGVIGRDVFAPALLNKWEFREDSGRGGDRAPRGAGGGKPFHGDRDGGGKRYGGGDRDGGGRDGGGYRGGRDRDNDDRPPRKTGWDGKPRDKKYYRNDG